MLVRVTLWSVTTSCVHFPSSPPPTSQTQNMLHPAELLCDPCCRRFVRPLLPGWCPTDRLLSATQQSSYVSETRNQQGMFQVQWNTEIHWWVCFLSTARRFCSDTRRGICLWSPYGIARPYIFSCCGLFLWSPYVIGRPYIFSSCFFFFFLLSFFFSSPNLSSRRLDVYHTSAHGVVLV